MNLSEKAHPDELEAILRKHDRTEYAKLFFQHENLKSLLDHHRQEVYDRALEFEKIISGEKKYQFKSDNLKIYHISPQIRILTENDQCIKWGFGKICDGCGKQVAIPHFCRERNHCPVCNRRRSHFRGRSIFDTLTLVPESYVSQTILTYPEDYFSLTDLSKEDIESQIHVHSREFVKRCFGEKVGGVKRVHSWHSWGDNKRITNPLDKSPLSKPHWHVHVLTPSFVFNPVTVTSLDNSRKITVDYTIQQFRVFKSKEQLNEMRRIWAEIIGYDKPVNFYYEWSNKKSKISHWSKYISRGSILDINEWLKDKGAAYKLTQKEESWFWYHTDYKKRFQRIRWFGFLCNTQRGKILKYLFPKDFDSLLKMDKKYIWVCPKCVTPLNMTCVDATKMEFTDKVLLAIQCESETWEMYKNGLKTVGVG